MAARTAEDLPVHEDERVSYEVFFRAVAAFAHELADAGVAKGDRVAIIMRNIPEWPVAFYAAAALGAIVTPLNACVDRPESSSGPVDSGTKIAIVDAERLERIAEHLPGIRPDLKHASMSRSARRRSPTR